MCFNIMGIRVDSRMKKSSELQAVLSKYGCNIKMRLGLHEAGDVCSDQGLILLQLSGSKEEIISLEEEIKAIDGMSVKWMEIC